MWEFKSPLSQTKRNWGSIRASPPGRDGNCTHKSGGQNGGGASSFDHLMCWGSIIPISKTFDRFSQRRTPDLFAVTRSSFSIVFALTTSPPSPSDSRTHVARPCDRRPCSRVSSAVGWSTQCGLKDGGVSLRSPETHHGADSVASRGFQSVKPRMLSPPAGCAQSTVAFGLSGTSQTRPRHISSDEPSPHVVKWGGSDRSAGSS
jgi:hypothetical protein